MDAESMYKFALGAIEEEEQERASGVGRIRQEVWKARAIRRYVELAVAIARREGFEAARLTEEDYRLSDGYGNPSVSPVYEAFEDYERTLKEKP